MKVDGQNVIYTGDTASITPFLPYIDNNTVLYTEISAYDSGVHLYMYNVLPKLKELSENGNKIYLMHVDDENAVRNAVKDIPLLEIVSVENCNDSFLSIE